MENKDLTVQNNANAIVEQALNQGGILSQEAIDKAGQQIQLFASLKKVALKGTIERDWCNQSGAPYLQATGTDKIAVAFGIHITNQKAEKELYEDEFGKFYLFTVTAEFTYNRRALTCDGTGSTRDPFFGKHTVCEKCDGKGYSGKCNDNKCGGKLVPKFKRLHQVDIPSVKKKATTNCHNRGIKKVLGLNFDWDDLEAAGLDIEKIQSIDRKGQTKAPQRTNTLTETHNKVWSKLTELYGNGAADKLKELTSFEGSNGHVEGKSDINHVSEKQVGFLWSKVQKIKKPVSNKNNPNKEGVPF